jgi:TFIIF-interacting CTD phosphatase-like protein
LPNRLLMSSTPHFFLPASHGLKRNFGQPANGIPIEGWTDDPSDEALLDLLPVLDSLRFTKDVRHILSLRSAGLYTLPS